MHRAASSTAKPAPTTALFAPPLVERVDLDGAFLLRSPVPLGKYAPSLAHLLRGWARKHPKRDFLAERDKEGGWRRVTYSEASQSANRIAQALLDRGLGPERPLMILSGNAIDHALLMLGAYVAGVPVVPVSVAYSLLSQDHEKLKHIFGEVQPGALFVANGKAFAAALRALPLTHTEIIVAAEPADGVPATNLASLLATEPTKAVAKAFAKVGPDTIGKILYTSGSTGMPKGVINTHRMMCANQRMAELVWPFVRNVPIVLVDWLPWNHTFGGNHNFNMVLAQGGTLYIDAGKPAPGLVEETIKNLREISPTVYFNVPAGYGMILPYLEKDEALARKFFAELRVILFAGAALSQDLWDRLEALSARFADRLIPKVSSWGSTETAPLATAGHLITHLSTVVGLPAPGVTLKSVPAGSKLEVRVKGPSVFPGYFKRPDLTQTAFDADGFYCIGDAMRLVDDNDPSKGLVFNGRITEDFKLDTGTWVNTGAVRVAALAAAAPALQDAVIAGQDKPYVGLLAWPSAAGLKSICKDLSLHDDVKKLMAAPDVREHVRQGIARHNAAQGGSSMRIKRVVLMAEPASIDANEITDKGYVNQRATLERRHALVEALYDDPPPADVIVID